MSTLPITELIVATDALPPSLVLASKSFIATLAEVEQQAAALKITDSKSAQEAADLQRRLTTAGAELEKQRKALKAPFILINQKIDKAAEAPALRIEHAKNAIKLGLTRYDADQRELAAKLERERQAELRRLEAIRLAEIEAENARKAELERIAKEAADRAAAANIAEDVDFDEEEVDMDEPAPEPVPQKTETQVALENIRHAPVVAAPKPVGVMFKTTLVAVVTDVNKLPDMFVDKSPRLKAISSTFCSGWREGNPIPVCDGVRFEVKRDAVSTGRY